jgi:polar amino acid transport system substrate-binding protein
MKKKVLGATTLLLLLFHPVFSSELKILTENLPPLNYVKDDILVGPAVEIVKEIQKRVGSHEPIKVYPWARAYQMALREENIVLFGMTHTTERNSKFKWIGPIARKRDILVARKGSNLKIQTLEDAKNVKRIGTIRGDAKENFLKSQGFTNLVSTHDERKNVQKLIFGRIDLWVYKQPGLKTVCELAGVDYNHIEEVFSLREFDISIAFSKRTSDLIVQKWKSAFNEMIADGTITRIQRKWGIE